MQVRTAAKKQFERSNCHGLKRYHFHRIYCTAWEWRFIFKANSEQTKQIIADAEKKAEEYAKNSENGFLEAADENAKVVIKQLLEAANEGYNIVVEFK